MKYLFGLFITLLVAACGTQDKSTYTLIQHASIITMTEPEKVLNASILLKDSVIWKIGSLSEKDVPENTQVIDASGQYIIPGLWDTHVHLYKITRQSIPELLRYGITSVRDMGGDTDTLKNIIRDIKSGEIDGPRVLFCGPTFESPSWMQWVAENRNLGEIEDMSRTRVNLSDKKDAQRLVDSVAALGVDFIKMRNFKDAETYWALAKAVKHAGLKLSGHAPYGIDPLLVSDSGQTSFEHAWYPSLSGLDEETVNKILKEFKANNCVLVPTLITWKNNGFSSYSNLDSLVNGPAGVRDARVDKLPSVLLKEWRAQLEERKKHNNLKAWNWAVMENMLNETRRMYQYGIKIMAGSDVTTINVYPGHSLHEELKMFVNDMKLTPYQALATATTTPAEVFNLQHEIGTIEEGKRADLVILAGNPLLDITNTTTAKWVFKNGKVVYHP